MGFPLQSEFANDNHSEAGSSKRCIAILRALAAFLLALRDKLIEEPLLYFCDNQSLLKAVNRWIGDGGKATGGGT